MSKELTLARVKNLLELYSSGAIPTLSIHEVHPDLDKSSRLNYLYFTLTVCLNFQRSSPAMWASAFATFKDPETNYLFYPEEIIKYPREKIQADLVKHKLALQKNKHTDIWIAISTTLNKYFNNDPREFLKYCDFNVINIIQTLQKTRKKDFPYLSGLKLSNYWLFILSKFTDLNLKNAHEISIIPDTHVIKSTAFLGLSNEKATSLQIENIWRELLKDSGISPVDVHPVLWNWSRNNFVPEV